MVSGKPAVDILLITADRQGAFGFNGGGWNCWFGGCLVGSGVFLGG